VIISHQINRVQLLAIQDKLKEEVDFKLLNYFKVLGD